MTNEGSMLVEKYVIPGRTVVDGLGVWDTEMCTHVKGDGEMTIQRFTFRMLDSTAAVPAIYKPFTSVTCKERDELFGSGTYLFSSCDFEEIDEMGQGASCLGDFKSKLHVRIFDDMYKKIALTQASKMQPATSRQQNDDKDKQANEDLEGAPGAGRKRRRGEEDSCPYIS